MDIHDYARILRRNLVLIISLALIGVSGGALVALTTPARYTASTQLYVSVGTNGGTTSEMTQGTNFARQAVTTYVSVIPSAIVLDPVIEQLNLDESAEELAHQVSASAGLNTVVIDVTVNDPSPEQAARIANAIGESFTTVVAEQLEAPTGDRPSPVRIETLQPAQVPLSPSAPNMRLSLALGGLLGLAAGVGIAVLREVLDTRIRTVKDVEEITGAPTLGGIALDPQAKTRPLVVAAAARDPRAEAYRTLRTNVQFLALGGGPAAYVVTSAGPSEGKSTTSANLAIAFAETGARVALLDGDLRKPKVADYFGIEGGLGLADVLVGRVAASDVIQRWGRGTLFLLPAGTVPPNPAELLGSQAMAKLMRELKAAFDVIIVDAPPTLLVTDAAVVSRHTNGAIVVAAAGSTTKPRLASAVKNVEAVGSKVLGTVVTMVPTAGADKTAYGTYAYAAQ
ncbi:polysaccharide biosynthesis tyrosine autokinase [Microbacterium sp. zg.Y625]|uniref:polysaccharide biosynthesis tyrosine autokinase n=1 Tax=Microbacterium jiangjiandongii TaxID=3049071 RepID=UPI00214B71E2|nr:MULTISPECIES: polysaccharide biosynthesis tyrosine autokinase [unclassified Microbacterium]MCR2793534.1 polysaccharide biosynthesis tyrosine autokinase [Microbacterium sp. zg.Y625]MCR2815863.1 polysaccharide biosynthesis tyrosine autokinase [Microbacterium sp. zg.Y843]WIM25888.1 polysaccharide biosynthesis tyrosine autokinase [Microbacterium sp. zg-Y625]